MTAGTTPFASARRERFSPLQELSLPLPPDVLSVVDDQLAAREDALRHAARRHPLVAGIVNIHVMSFRTDCPLLLRIEDDDVGVAADGDGPLLREKSEDLRRVGRGDLHDALERAAPL